MVQFFRGPPQATRGHQARSSTLTEDHRRGAREGTAHSARGAGAPPAARASRLHLISDASLTPGAFTRAEWRQLVRQSAAEQQKGPRLQAFGDGASRARTGDLLGAIQALSQLSYSPARA